MIEHELLRDEGVLVVTPKAPLSASDFESLAAEIDPYIESNGELHGLLISAKSFPGWEDLAAMSAHLKFVRDHHRKVRRIAAVTDDRIVSVLPRFVNHFVAAEVRHFAYDDREAAIRWLREDGERPI